MNGGVRSSPMPALELEFDERWAVCSSTGGDPMHKIIAFSVLLVAGSAAWAKGGSPQTHHCKMPDGTMDMAKTKAQCKAAKGTWAKDEPAAGGGETGSGGEAKTPPPAEKPAEKAPAPTGEKK
jgi:hypothetical protein